MENEEHKKTDKYKYNYPEKKKNGQDFETLRQKIIYADRLVTLGGFVSDVAHKINNSNHYIRLTASILNDVWKSILPILEDYYIENGDFIIGGFDYSDMRQEMPDYINGILTGSKQIESLTGNLERFFKKENKEINENLNVNNIVKAAVTLTHNLLIKSTNNFNIEYGEDIPEIRGNFQELEQTVINLIRNSCTSLRDKKESICISTSYNKNKKQIEIIIRDEGTEIVSEELSARTPPFITADKNGHDTESGMTIAAFIIEEHNGTLKVISEQRKGTTAIVSLPAALNNINTERNN